MVGWGMLAGASCRMVYIVMVSKDGALGDGIGVFGYCLSLQGKSGRVVFSFSRCGFVGGSSRDAG